MELVVKLHFEPKDTFDGAMPESADEVVEAIKARTLGKSWRLVAVEPLGELTHRVYASDGVVSVDRGPSVD